jgi:hypothetical protein
MEPTLMDAGKILHELTHIDGLPSEALKAASAQRSEMVPLFVEEIETYLALDLAARPSRHRCFSFFICSGNGGKRPLIGRWRVC